MAGQIGALRVTLGANTAQFEQGMRRAASTARTAGASIRGSFSGLNNLRGIALNAAAAFGGIFTVAGLRRGLEYAASLGEVASQLGVTTRALQVYRAVAGQVGVEQQALDTGLAKLTLSIGQAAGGVRAQADAFRALGITVRDIAGNIRPTEEILLDLADAMGRLPNPQARFAALFPILGRNTRGFINVLSEGRQALMDYARQLEASGQILSDSEINRADEIADKVEALNRQMSVSWARTVAQNAGSIMGLASALHTLTNEALRFLNAHPQLVGAGVGAIAGRLIGGVPGMVAGGLIGSEVGQNAADQNMDIQFRLTQLREAGMEMARFNNPRYLADQGRAARELRRQAALQRLRFQSAQTRRATALQNSGAPFRAQAAPGIEDEAPAFHPAPSGGGGGPSARGGTAPAETAERNRHDEIRRAYEIATELRRAATDELRAQLDVTDDADQRAALSQSLVDLEQQQDEASRRLSVSLGDRTEAEATALGLVEDHVADLKRGALRREEEARQREEAQTLASAALQTERDIVESLSGMDDTAVARLRTQLALLNIEQRAERLALEAQSVDYTRSAAERQAARDRLAALPTIYGNRANAIGQQNRGPLADFAAGLPNTVDRMNEALQSVAVNGLGSIQDAILGVIMGTDKMGVAFKRVAASIIADLIRIQLQRTVISALSNALSGLFGGFSGSIGSIGAGVGNAAGAGAGFGGAASAFGGFRAAGGPVLPGRTYVVGEKGPELLHMGEYGRVIPNERIGGGGEVHVHQTFRFEGVAVTKDEFIQGLVATKSATQEAIRQAQRRRG